MEKIYIPYHPETFLQDGAGAFFEEGTQPENFTDVLITEQWACPKFNPDANQWVNDATAEAQNEYLYQIKVSRWHDVTEHVNEDFDDTVMAGGADAVLNAEYPEVGDMFRVYAPHVGTGVLYIKITAAIWISMPLAIAK